MIYNVKNLPKQNRGTNNIGEWNMGKPPEVDVWTGYLVHSVSYFPFNDFFAWLLEMSCYFIEHCPGTALKI